MLDVARTASATVVPAYSVDRTAIDAFFEPARLGVLAPLAEAWSLLSEGAAAESADALASATRVRTVQFDLDLAGLRESGWWDPVAPLLSAAGWGGPLGPCVAEPDARVRRVCARVDAAASPGVGTTPNWRISSDDPAAMRRCALRAAPLVSPDAEPRAGAGRSPGQLRVAVEPTPGTWLVVGDPEGPESSSERDESWYCGPPPPADSSAGSPAVLRLRVGSVGAAVRSSAGTSGPEDPACLLESARASEAVLIEVGTDRGLRVAVSLSFPSADAAASSKSCVDVFWRNARGLLRATAAGADAADLEAVLGITPRDLVDAMHPFRDERAVGVRLDLPEAAAAGLRGWLGAGP
jgi:hypothetical protein